MAKKSKYTYHGHEKVIVWNEDKNLTPIKYRLPDPPPLHTIEGYGLPPEEQYWRNHPLPPKLAKINSMVYGEDGKTELTNRMKVEMLEKDPEFYREEIEYIVKEWERRENGYWFFNNGVPTMIIGDHYFYLQWWPIDGALPDYRNRDRRWFWFWLMVEHDDDCFGFNNPKQRREGATKKVCLVRWNRTAMNYFFTTGLQSKDESHASETHFLEIYEVSRYVPFFFQPITDNAQNVWKEIRFYAPRSKNHSDFGEEGLSSFIDFRDSGAKAYDGTKRWLLHNDEVGKCLKINTLVLMHDGGTKYVQDVQIGDKVMGWDSTPRKVLSLSRGRDMMYDVIPNKGDSWGCNSKHTLVVKSASDQHAGQANPKGSTREFSVEEYLGFSALKKKHLMQFRVGVEFAEKKLFIDPYLLGVWLGDGGHRGAVIHICNTDFAILDGIKPFIQENGLILNELKCESNKGCTSFSIKRPSTIGKNHLLEMLREYNLILNKHIPKDFLINSTENRKKLLAGLIDTDGHKSRGFYEITQVRKELAYQIVFLARSLGYYVNIAKKNTSIASTGFKGKAFRISIHGNDLHTLPIRVERKKMPPFSLHKNRRNPQHSGFKVIPTEEDDYYGFEVDGDHKILLGDFTVIHNCGPDIDVNERVRIQIPCLTNIVRNSPRKGKMINTSTTGEMEHGGGKKFKELCDASDYHKRNANKMTTSGLYLLFQPATEGMEGVDPHTKIPFIDKYGNANEEAIRKFLMAKREDNRAAGKMADYIEECRQYPLEYNDCWKTSARQCIFNMIKIEDRLDHFRNGHTEKTRGNLKWANGKRDTRVEWEPADNGRWFLSYKFPDPRFANRMTIDGDGCKWPANKSKFIAGGDPYKFDKTKQKGSKGAGVVFWKYDHSIDGGKTDSLTWDSYRFIATYANRPHTLEDYGEDMIMMCVYFGCEMFPEINVDFLYKYFTERGYGGYLYFKFDPNTNKYAQLPGQYTHIKQKQQMFSVLQSYIEHHVHREKHNELIEEWKSLVDEFTDFDLAVASSLALIGAGDSVANYDEEIDKATDIKDYFTRYVYPE